MSEKTTLYFLCSSQHINTANRDKEDPESGSTILFLPIDQLIEKMKTQSERYHRSDIDESTVLERVKRLLGQEKLAA